MSENIKFFNAALKLLRVGNAETGDIGTTENEFAENYANASGTEKGSSIWNQYYEEGKKEYAIVNSDGKDGINQEEYDKLKCYIDKISQPFKHFAEDFLSGFDGNNKNISSIRTRIGDNTEAVPEKENNGEVSGNANVQKMSEEELAKIKEQFINKKKNDNIEKMKNIQAKPKFEAVASEQKNLKMIETMSREEVIQELQEYDNTFKAEDSTGLEVLRKFLQEAREYNIINDKQSDVVDHHVGTFMQGSHGTCTVLSKINGLSDETLNKIFHEEPEGSGNYRVTFPLDYGNEEKSVIITKEELEKGEVIIENILLNDFSSGDKDVTLLEMAFMKRFGTYISLSGADIKLIEEIFTFPEDKGERVLPGEQRGVESYHITEDKITQALRDGNHPIVTITMASRLPADFSYKDVAEVKTNNGETFTASWGFASQSDETDARTNLKRLLGKDSPIYSQIDNMPTGEFMDLANKFVGAEFDDGAGGTQLYGFMGAIMLSNGASVSEAHALSIVDYNPETKTVMIANPNYNSALIPVPLEVMEKFFEISV